MDDIILSAISSERQRREISQSGVTVTIETVKVAADQWLLRIYGKDGQKSEWLEMFRCADEAMAAACTAIRYEGIEEFYDDPAFSIDNMSLSSD